IDAVFDQAFAALDCARANVESNVKESARLPNAWPQEVLGDVESWPRRSSGHECDILDSVRVPITKKDRKAGDIPYYGATGIVDWVNEFLFDEPLVLVGEDGAKWGAGDQSAFRIKGKAWVNNHAHVLRPNRHVLDDD